ncbi:MAG: hypothetical protein HY819_13030 [Acidobacteria bacterium]|nr:hypothetical protein [Acidobacteriota bacterium]
MKKQIIIVICILLAPLVFLTSCQSAPIEQTFSPSQIVAAFYQACKSGSYDLAKGYLSTSSINFFDQQGKQDPDKSLQAFMEYCNNSLAVPELSNVLVQGEKINSNSASVDTAFVYQKMEPNFVPHFLVKDEKGWYLDMVSTLEQLSNDAPKNDFEKELANSGQWLKHPNYGNVWRPKEVGYNWQPYCNDGKFLSTKDGWQWESERDWGKRVFHYGRWAQAGPLGWVWVPDDDYAPSWVTWRANDEYVGWSPIPPGFGLNDKEKSFSPPSNAWVFLPTREFVAMVNSNDKSTYTKSRKPIKESHTYVNNTTYYGGVDSYQGRLVNNALSTSFLEERSGVKIVRRILSAPIAAKVGEEILQNTRDRDDDDDYDDYDNNYYKGKKHKGFIPPGQDRIAPGQAKKLGKKFDRPGYYYEKNEHKHDRFLDKEERRALKQAIKEEKKRDRKDRKYNKHHGRDD